MANFEKAFNLLLSLEFNQPSNFLHQNKTENDYTVGGIYKYAHPLWEGWTLVNMSLAKNSGDIKAASVELYASKIFMYLVREFYKKNYWEKMQFDKLDSDKVANEIFIFAINSGTKNAIRKAQKIVGATPDGLVGRETLGKLNAYDPDKFDMVFDEVEIAFYNDLIKKNPSFAIYKNGWHNRARSV